MHIVTLYLFCSRGCRRYKVKLNTACFALHINQNKPSPCTLAPVIPKTPPSKQGEKATLFEECGVLLSQVKQGPPAVLPDNDSLAAKVVVSIKPRDS